MERNGNYIAVGAFIFVVLTLGFFWLIWLTGDDRSYERYSMYFEGSVLGLSEGSEVTYMGVNVGRVMSISLHPDHPGMVQVLADIEESTPLRPNTQAKLSMRGVTGLLIIELFQSEEIFHDDFRKDSLGFKEIPVKPSLISKFVKELPELSGQATSLLTQLSVLLSDDNIQNISSTLANMEKFSSNLAGGSDQFDSLLVDARAAMNQMATAADALTKMSGDIGPQTAEMMASLNAAAAQADKAMAGIVTMLNQNEAGVGRFVDAGLSELTELIIDTRGALNEVGELAQTLKEDPSQLIYQPQQSGVELQR